MDRDEEKKLVILNIKGQGDIWVSNEFFKKYLDILRAQKRKESYECKCLIVGKSGRLIKCRASCAECSYFKTGRPLSLDSLENTSLEPHIDGEVVDYINLKEIKDTISWAIYHLDKLESEILKLYFFENMTIRDIAAKLHLSKSGVDRIKNKAVATIKLFLIKVYGSEENARSALA